MTEALKDAVVAAARAWADSGEWEKSAVHLLDAVDAYEAALSENAASMQTLAPALESINRPARPLVCGRHDPGAYEGEGE